MDEENQNQNSSPAQAESPAENPNKMSPKIITAAILVIVVIIGLGYFLTQKNRSTDSNLELTTQDEIQDDSMSNPSLSTENQSTGTAATSDSSVITVEGGAFYFKPNVIKAKLGQKVTIEFKNAGGSHDFTIDELNVKTKTIGSGDTAKVEFTPSKTGSFEFYCSISNHRQMGMTGTLTVE